MGENIQPLHLPISKKNIGIPSQFEYQKALIYRIEDFIRRLRWKCFFIGAPTFNPVMYENPPKSQIDTSSQSSQLNDEQQEIHPEFEERQWYGFKSEKSPPVIKELVRFEEELYKLARRIKFRKVTYNKFQNMLNQTIKNVKMSRDMIVPADKSHMLYKVPVPTYQKMLRD